MGPHCCEYLRDILFYLIQWHIGQTAADVLQNLETHLTFGNQAFIGLSKMISSQ